MLALKKFTALVALSLFLSSSFAQSADTYCTQKTVALAAAVTAVAAGAVGAIWYACQPEDPETVKANLFELYEYLTLHYEYEIAYLYGRKSPYSPLYISLQRTRELDADLNKLDKAIKKITEATANGKPAFFLTESDERLLKYALELLYALEYVHTQCTMDPCYIRDVQNEQLVNQLRWERWCRQCDWPTTTRIFVDVIVTQKPVINTPQCGTKTDKSATLNTRSTSIFDPQYSHGAADL